LAAAVAVVLAVVASLPVLLRLLSASAGGKKTNPKAPLPPGSFGLPFIGQTLSLVRALRANTADDWLRRCVAAYGPVSRLRLFGCPTAFLVGTSANKFIFTSAGVTAKTPESFARMVGRRTIRDVVGDEHRRVRAMMVQFLRVDAVKRHVASMDGEVRRHLDAEWHGRGTVAVMPSMKSLTFDVMCAAIFGLGTGAVRWELWTEFQELVRGIWAVPVNLPFTTYSRCLAASQRGRRAVARVIQERRAKLERGESSPASDVVSLMLVEDLPDEEIIDNVMFLMVAAHDTTAALHTFLIRQLDADKDAYDKVVQGNSLRGLIIASTSIHADADGLFESMDDGMNPIRARRDCAEQGGRGGAVVGGPRQDAVHLGGGAGDAADGASGVHHDEENCG